MKRVGIVGDGYTAAELLRLLLPMDEYDVTYISSADNIGTAVSALYPQFGDMTQLVCEPTATEAIISRCDGVFLALPHGQSMPLAAALIEAGLYCVDLGADFRLRDAGLYRSYYELEHTAPELLSTAVYGIPELYREQIAVARLIANPGCFPTSAIMPLVPLLAAGLIEHKGIIVDSKSGVSGAGRGMKETSHYCNVNEGVHPYGVGTHRHAPEIRQQLELAAAGSVQMVFTPHLIPMSRGILTTTYSYLADGANEGDARAALAQAYKGEYFVHLLPPGQWPHTRWVYASNHVQISLAQDKDSHILTAVCAIDNLCRGASAQAVQNMNLMLGIPERRGLELIGLYP
ncbi:MAG: N-acetyl-gamma-glutamyl-phosphate reductase [Syntrophomonadaceae bacterium]|nr:N-acetyl-gamma-glutamyl-phosphate reductase [Syntrophomonadaceae bacterium]